MPQSDNRRTWSSGLAWSKSQGQKTSYLGLPLEGTVPLLKFHAMLPMHFPVSNRSAQILTVLTFQQLQILINSSPSISTGWGPFSPILSVAMSAMHPFQRFIGCRNTRSCRAQVLLKSSRSCGWLQPNNGRFFTIEI